jgi:hypothetical protein
MKKRPTGMDIVKRAIARQFTKAQTNFKGVTILNERPEGMSYKEYKKLRAQQSKAIKQSLR